MLDQLPYDACSEELCIYDPYFKRRFKVTAIDTIANIDGSDDKRIVLIASKEPE